MARAFRYSTITGSLNQIADRFMTCGYKRNYRYEEIVEELARLEVLDGVELCFSTQGGVESDRETLVPLLERYGCGPAS